MRLAKIVQDRIAHWWWFSREVAKAKDRIVCRLPPPPPRMRAINHVFHLTHHPRGPTEPPPPPPKQMTTTFFWVKNHKSFGSFDFELKCFRVPALWGGGGGELSGMSVAIDVVFSHFCYAGIFGRP